MTTNRTNRRQKNLSLVAFAALLLIMSTVVKAVPEIQHWTTEKNTRIYFVHAPQLPMVDIQIVFDAGSARDDKKSGLAQLTNSLLDDGAGSLNADQLAVQFEKLGAIYDSSVDRDMATLSLRSLTEPRLLQPAVDTFALLLGKPSFPEKAIERERNRLIVAIRAKQQSPGSIAEDAFYQAIYADHPYASSPLGAEETLSKLDRANLVDFFQRYYVAENAIIAIVGDLDRVKAEDIAEQLSLSLKTGKKAPALPEVKTLIENKHIHIEYPSTQTHILWGQPGMRRGDPDYYTLYVGNHVLGGSGLVSRISEEIRENRGLSYSAYSYFFPMRLAGPFIVGLQTSTEQADEAIQVMKEVVQTFIERGPTSKELEASKQNITGGFPLRIASNKKIANYLAVIGFYDLPLDYLNKFNENIKRVNLEKVVPTFKRRLDPQKMITVTVGAKG